MIMKAQIYYLHFQIKNMFSMNEKYKESCDLSFHWEEAPKVHLPKYELVTYSQSQKKYT